MNKKQIAALVVGVAACFGVTRFPWRMNLQNGATQTLPDGTIVHTMNAQFPAGELAAMIAVAAVAGFIFYKARG
ncbi:hypothetical protein [Capsulimonas corticalis]|nr:hypothetical protein [Capsulimonas corticalis]